MSSKILKQIIMSTIFVYTLTALVMANDTVTVTIHSKVRQTFMGLGAGSANKLDYQQLPANVQDTISTLVWKDANFKYLRLWARLGENSVNYFMDRYGKIIADAKVKQPNLKLLLAPDFRHNPIFDTLDTDDKIHKYSIFFAQLLYDLKKLHGITFEATGIINEPDHHDYLMADKVPTMIKFFRQELDRRNLQDIKIIGPETSNVDRKLREMVDSIAVDSVALSSLAGFASHSYNMCLTKQMRDKVEPYNKEYWQTESAEESPEDFNDPMRAVYCSSRFLSDINLGVTHWFWFLAYGHFVQKNNSSKLIGFDTESGEWRTFLRYYYFKNLSATFRTGIQMRSATSSLSYQKDLDRTNNQKDRFRDMENTEGIKPDICVAGGVNSDSTWAIGITNQTDIPSTWSKAFWGDAKTYDATIFVEELADSPSIRFTAIRSNDSTSISQPDTITMSFGKIKITLKPHDLVTLKALSKFEIGITKNFRQEKNTKSFTVKKLNSSRSFPVQINYIVKEPDRISLSVFNLNGTIVKTLTNNKLIRKNGSVIWNGTNNNDKAVPSGIYLIQLKSSNTKLVKRISVTR